MTRSRSTSPAGLICLLQPAGCPRKGSRPLLLLVLLGLLSGSPAAWAQPPPSAVAHRPIIDSASSTSSAPPARPVSHWATIWAVLGGIAVGALGAWLWARKPSASKSNTNNAPIVSRIPQTTVSAEPVRKKPAQNISKGVSFQSMREVQGTAPKPQQPQLDKINKSKPNFNSRSTSSIDSWPPVPSRPVATDLDSLSQLPPENVALEPRETIVWDSPITTPPAIQELIDSSPSADINSASLPEPPSEEKPSIQVGREGWSIPPTKPYSHEEAPIKTPE
jgi:hypothetical protein